jgi:hypothetical protein
VHPKFCPVRQFPWPPLTYNDIFIRTFKGRHASIIVSLSYNTVLYSREHSSVSILYRAASRPAGPRAYRFSVNSQDFNPPPPKSSNYQPSKYSYILRFYLGLFYPTQLTTCHVTMSEHLSQDS